MVPSPRQRSHRSSSRLQKEGNLPLFLLMGFLVVIHLLQQFPTSGFDFPWMLIPARAEIAWHSIRAGQGTWESWQALAGFFTYSLFHGGFDHLLNNLLFLWIFAGLILRMSGYRQVYLIFVFTAVTGGILHFALNRGAPFPLLGASGAVMGFEGAYLALAIRWHLPDPFIWPMSRPVPPAHLAALAVLGIAFDYQAILAGSPGNIAYGAHLGGFFGGLLLGSFVLPKPKS